MDPRSATTTTVFDGSRPSTGIAAAPTATQLLAANETLASNEPPLDPTDPNSTKSIYDFQVLNCYHELYDLAQHKGSVVLICNVASKCKEYTESCYTLLTKLYHKYRQEGFVVLAFPCNEFGNGEPGNEDEIADNISCQFPRLGEVDFPIMAKVEVNGDHASALYVFLKSRIRGTIGQSSVKWNFTSFLCDQHGQPLVRFAPEATYAEVETRVVELLHPKPPPTPRTHGESPATVQAAAVAAAAAAAAAEEQGTAPEGQDVLTPRDFSGCPTPTPSEVVHREAALAETTVMSPEDLTAVADPADASEENGNEEPNADSLGRVPSSSNLFDATARTAEGVDLLMDAADGTPDTHSS